jgi:hypothetical protein
VALRRSRVRAPSDTLLKRRVCSTITIAGNTLDHSPRVVDDNPLEQS